MGCWTGSLVFDDSQEPLIFCSSLKSEASSETGISVAVGCRDLLYWNKDPLRQVRNVPPPGFDLLAFRDPFVRRVHARWEMLVGGGIRGVGGGVFSYCSEDLRTWRFAGLVAAGVAGGGPGGGLEEIWECPQLFPVDDKWVLVVSVWRNGEPDSVQWATGPRDAATGELIPERWGRLDEGGEYYASTAFVDASGQWTVLGWSREGGGERAAGQLRWAGVLTMPRRVALRGDGSVAVSPAIDEGRLFLERGTSHFRLGPSDSTSVVVEGQSARVRVRIEELSGAGSLRLREAGSNDDLVTFCVDSGNRELRTHLRGGLGPGGQAREAYSCVLSSADVETGGEVSIFVDQSIVELFTGSGVCSTHRVYPHSGVPLEVVVAAEDCSWFTGEVAVAVSRLAGA